MRELTAVELSLLRICFDARINQVWGIKRLSKEERKYEVLKVKSLAEKFDMEI